VRVKYKDRHIKDIYWQYLLHNNLGFVPPRIINCHTGSALSTFITEFIKMTHLKEQSLRTSASAQQKFLKLPALQTLLWYLKKQAVLFLCLTSRLAVTSAGSENSWPFFDHCVGIAGIFLWSLVKHQVRQCF